MNKNGLRVNDKNQVVLCGTNICCPVLEKLPDGRYKLTDDYGKSCIITAEQARLISKGVKKCDEVNKPSKQVSEQQLICG